MSIYVFKKIDKTENFTNELKSIQKQKKKSGGGIWSLQNGGVRTSENLFFHKSNENTCKKTVTINFFRILEIN